MKYYHKGVFLLLILAVLGGCDKFLDTTLPKSAIEETELFRQEEAATSALTAIYASMITGLASSYQTALLTGLSADELGNPPAEASGFYVNAILPENTANENYWRDAYNTIYRVNATYEGCRQSITQNPEIKKQLTGEALFIRAYFYFYLVNFYGDVPLVLTTDYRQNERMNRTPKHLIYDQILKDLYAASGDLQKSYIGQNNLPTTSERIRPNKAVATALLARIYLYLERYVEAESLATSLIDDSTMYALVGPKEVFLKNSKEALWQLLPPTPNFGHINTMEGEEFILSGKPGKGEKPWLNKELLSAFEKGDLREATWIGLYNDSAGSIPYAYKYKARRGDEVTEYTVVVRLAEQYLIRAEARTHKGQYLAALADLNIIRRRAGLSLLTNVGIPLNYQTLMKLILKERQVELFTEQGHRWLDLKRIGDIDRIMNKVIVEKGGLWKKGRELWPIPARDISLNGQLQQNPGY